MTYATSTPMNAPKKYNTIKTDAPDYLLAILSHYSSKSDSSCLVCLPSIALPRTSHVHAPIGQARVDFGLFASLSIPRRGSPPLVHRRHMHIVVTPSPPLSFHHEAQLSSSLKRMAAAWTSTRSGGIPRLGFPRPTGVG